MHGGQNDGDNDNNVDDVLSSKHIVLSRNRKKKKEELKRKEEKHKKNAHTHEHQPFPNQSLKTNEFKCVR